MIIKINKFLELGVSVAQPPHSFKLSSSLFILRMRLF